MVKNEDPERSYRPDRVSMEQNSLPTLTITTPTKVVNKPDLGKADTRPHPLERNISVTSNRSQQNPNEEEYYRFCPYLPKPPSRPSSRPPSRQTSRQVSEEHEQNINTRPNWKTFFNENILDVDLISVKSNSVAPPYAEGEKLSLGDNLSRRSSFSEKDYEAHAIDPETSDWKRIVDLRDVKATFGDEKSTDNWEAGDEIVPAAAHPPVSLQDVVEALANDKDIGDFTKEHPSFGSGGEFDTFDKDFLKVRILNKC